MAAAELPGTGMDQREHRAQLLCNDQMHAIFLSSCEPFPVCLKVNRIPVVHGSALVQTGETQSLATATVGSPEDEQRMQGLLDADNRRLIVHFNFPPYASNNVRLPVGCASLGERST